MGTDAAAVLLDDDIRGAEEMSDACDEEENRQQEHPPPSLPSELQPKPPPSRIPEAALACLDPGDVPWVNHLGDPLPSPTFLESQVLSRARVIQQILVLHLAGRPPDVYP
ncbi:hypothetical protein PLESTB_000210000 [Pleodorina starrii]|uniref:Uncharacterized protein n=1 Tax=Pleodorina starrii TaxID=330485 RepID=A0A9W6EYK9_9CHLO|nr:hypothetical protein PLESTB_000210000 [Pleodorina starrii]